MEDFNYSKAADASSGYITRTLWSIYACKTTYEQMDVEKQWKTLFYNSNLTVLEWSKVISFELYLLQDGFVNDRRAINNSIIINHPEANRTCNFHQFSIFCPNFSELFSLRCSYSIYSRMTLKNEKTPPAPLATTPEEDHGAFASRGGSQRWSASHAGHAGR